MTRERFEEYSAWAAEPTEFEPSLSEHLRTEAVVVGGGLTGLSTALRLRRRGREVVLLEATFCGGGASGRNAGQLEPTIGRDIAFCLRTFGEKKGMALIRFAEESVYFTERMIAENKIDCDYEQSGNLCVGLHPAHRQAMIAASEITASVGLEMAFLPEDEMRKRKLPSSFLFGLKKRCGGNLNPSKLTRGMRKAALDAGVKIYEKSPVVEIVEGAPIKVRTPNGSITADQLMLATNAYTTSSLKRMKSALIPLRTTQYQTPPLSSDQLARIGWSGREAVTTAHESLENYRLTPDNRIVGGSKWVWYGYAATLAEGYRPKAFEKYDGLFKLRFPELPDVAIETFWGGWFAVTPDLLPLCGVTSKEKNVFYSCGYNGHGLAQANYMGDLMALEMLGEPQDELRVLDRRTIPLPPEPIRWLAISGMQQKIYWPDRKIDRELFASASKETSQ